MSGAGTFDLFGLSEARFETLLLVVIRVTFMLALLPVFSSNQIPVSVRLGVGFLITFVVSQTVPTLATPLQLGSFVAAILAQAFIGLVFGFVGFLVFTGIQFAGAILDVQIGFGSVSVLNPTTNEQVTIVSEFETAMATLIYLISNAHHLMLEGIADSFGLLPLPWAGVDAMLTSSVITFFTQALLIVLRIAGPIAIVLFLTTVALSLLSRVAPQVNVFSVGLPLQLLVGLTMMIVTMPLLVSVLPEVFAETPRQLDTVLRHMQPLPPGMSPAPTP